MLLQTEIKFTKHSQTREEDSLAPELVCSPQLLILDRQVAAQTQILGRQNFAGVPLIHDVNLCELL